MGGIHVRTESQIKSGNAVFRKMFTYHFKCEYEVGNYVKIFLR